MRSKILPVDIFHLSSGFFIPFGQTVSVAIGAGLKDVKYNWRILCE